MDVHLSTCNNNNNKRRRITAAADAGFLFLTSLATTTTTVCLKSDRVYTIGRSSKHCDFVFNDPQVSKRHCQIFFDALHRKILISDGFLSPPNNSNSSRFQSHFPLGSRASTNGVFVNGSRLQGGTIVELAAGDRVSLVCANALDTRFGCKIVGFVVDKFILTKEVLGFTEMELLDRWLIGEPRGGGLLRYKELKEERKGIAATKENGIQLSSSRYYDELSNRALLLLHQCRQTLQCVDPISFIRGDYCMKLDREHETVNMKSRPSFSSRENLLLMTSKERLDGKELHPLTSVEVRRDLTNVSSIEDVKAHPSIHHKVTVLNSEAIPAPTYVQHNDGTGASGKDTVDSSCTFKDLNATCINAQQGNSPLCSKKPTNPLCSSSGNKFYLNRLESMEDSLLDQHEMVSLPELLHPVGSLSRVFIATFTSDVLWFLSYCQVPNHLPVTIACHNAERCWSSDTDKRTSKPYPEFPNVVLVYPQFPEVVAFGKDRRRQGVACHHPKLLILQREDSIRVIVSSANLVSKQWNNVTNTVWWQDFPRRRAPDYSSLFSHSADGEVLNCFRSDFSAQLAGFVASLVADVPTQAQWVIELTKYDFGAALGYLVASVPGMHSPNIPYPLEPMHLLSAYGSQSRSIGIKFLGSVETSVVGLKHRYHTDADSKGAQLKTLAAFMGKCHNNTFGMSEVVLRRNTNIPADRNAVSVLISNLDEFSEGDYIQLGFLPRNIANWVAPLCDSGLFSFSACIYPKEVLAAALEGSNSKVQLILYVAQGPNFSEISSSMQDEHIYALCSLVASVQRCSGLWRLKEVLCQYKWPELLETDFIYGSSSIGTSVDPKFLAAFSAATGKRSVHFTDSEESDPEWGLWNVSDESRNPSMRILFPTIQRVKDAPCGIWPSRRLLCFSEKTWPRMRTIGILHDAIPHPSGRVGYPMHVKVARRRFQSKRGTPSFGWVYCGSHNFSPAAWGRPLATTSGVKSNGGFTGNTSFPMSGLKLHICNYELGIILVVPPPPPPKVSGQKKSMMMNLDDISLPFVLPAPKYQSSDRPATAQAMREALAELAEIEKENLKEAAEIIAEEMAGEEEEEEMIEEEEALDQVSEYVAEEREEEKAYAEALWSQVDSCDDGN